MVKIIFKKEPLIAGKSIFVNVYIQANENLRKSRREITISNIALETYDGKEDGVHTYSKGPYTDKREADEWVRYYFKNYHIPYKAEYQIEQTG